MAPCWLLAAALAVWAARGMWCGLRLVRTRLYALKSGFNRLGSGTVALRGRVVPVDNMEAPESGQPCVYVSLTVDQWGRNATMGGVTGQWLRMEDSEEAAPFQLTDGRHSVLVLPDSGRFQVQRLHKGQRLQQDGSLIRYSERLLQEGDEVLVMGQARPRGGFAPSEVYRGHNYRLVVDAGDGELRVFQPPLAMTGRLMLMVAARALALVPFVITSVLLLVVVKELFWPSPSSWYPLF